MKPSFVVLFVLMVLMVTAPAHVRAQTQNRAGVVVQFSNGDILARCVQFSEDSITGYDLLRRARIPIAVEMSGMGPGICKIGTEGCAYPNEKCFCQCQTLGEGCRYWVYSQLREGAWQVSGLGAGARRVRNGDVDGWAWGKGDGNSGIVPISVTLDQICSAGTVTEAQPMIAPTSTVLPPTELPPTKPPTTQTQTPAPSATTLPALPSASPAPALLTTIAATTPTANATARSAVATPAGAQSPATDDQSPTPSALSYIIFGGMAAGLIGVLVMLRRGGGKS
jgi:hypothetical protein